MQAEGRDPDQLTTSILYLPSETGEDTVREALDCGADRVILRVPTEDETTVLAFMDRFQKFTGL
jgi:succinyl-CoA synthetase alpha subunit